MWVRSKSLMVRTWVMGRPLAKAMVYSLLAGIAILLCGGAVAAVLEEAGFHSALRTPHGWVLAAAGALLVGAVCRTDRRALDRADDLYHAAKTQARAEYQELLERLNALETSIGPAEDLLTIYRALYEFVAASMPVNGLCVSRYDPEERLRHCTYMVAEGKEEDTTALPPMPMSDTPHARAVATGEVIVTEDRLCASAGKPRVDLGFDRDPRPPRSSIAVPLIVNGRVIGAFEAQSVEVAVYTNEHVTALRMAANLAAIATANVQLLERERQARDNVERSEARFRALVQNGSDMIRLVDREGHFSYVSPSVQRILGHDPAEAHGQDIFTRIHPDDRGWLRAAYHEAIERGRGEATYRVRHANGEWRWVETVGINLLEHPHVGAFVLNSRDITERKRAEEALREEKELTMRLLDALPGIFYTFDERGRYVRWNENLERVTGYTSEELSRMGPLDVIVPEEHDELQRLVAGVFEGGEAATATLTLRTKAGERVPYLCTGVRVVMDGRTYLTGTAIDIQAQQRAQVRIERLNRDLEERVQRLTSLHEVDRAITGSLDLSLVLDVLLEQVQRRLHVDAANVLLFHPEVGELRSVTGKGFRGGALRHTALQLGEGQAGKAALEREIVHLRDAGSVGRAFTSAPDIDREGFGRYWAVPLTAKGKVQGVLELFSRQEGEPDEDWYSFLGALATQAAIAMDNAMLFQSLERTNTELRLAYDTTIEGWAKALDLRDEETTGHSRRVTDMTVALGRALGLSEAELVHVRRGALLHDIGKMGVPDRILLKPGKLDAEEWAIMKRHPEYANDLLSPIPFLRPALAIPYAHHERWDGHGYPNGSKGTQIPRAARIFAVVDVYDALTSDRPYRSAWSRDEALAFIEEQAGSHFDPEVVAAFRALMGRDEGAEVDFEPSVAGDARGKTQPYGPS